MAFPDKKKSAPKASAPKKVSKDVTKTEIPKSRGKPQVPGASMGPGGSLPKPAPMAGFDDMNPSQFAKPSPFDDIPESNDVFRPDPEMNAASKLRGKRVGTSVPMYAQNEHEAHRSSVRKSVKNSIKEIKNKDKF